MSGWAVNKIAKWYNELDALEQIIIQEHVCSADPTPLDVLAPVLHTFQHVLHRRLNDLPQSLQDVLEDDATLRRAVTDIEREIAYPIAEDDLTSRYAWLTEEVTDDGGLKVLDLLCGLLWPGARSDGWVFDGDIEREHQKTLAALDMEPGETVTLGAAARLLRVAGVRVGSERSQLRKWLARSGLLVSTHQAMSPRCLDSDGNNSDASQVLIVRSSAGDNEQLLDACTLPFPTVADPLWEALTRLRTMYVEQGIVASLGTFLLKANHLQGELRQLAHQVSGAHVGEDGQWRLGVSEAENPFPTTNQMEHSSPSSPDLVPITPSPTVGEIPVSVDHTTQTAACSSSSEPGTSDDANVLPRGGMVMDAMETMLREVGHPLSTPDLRQRCAPARRLSPLRRELDADGRFRRSDRDTWALSEWGLPVYKPLRELIAEMVDESGGEVPCDEVVRRLTRQFSFKESSIRQTMSSSPFTSRGGVVRRLSDLEEQGKLWSSSAEDVPSAVELMKEMGLDF